jgi:DNA-binding NtrC family response regulator
MTEQTLSVSILTVSPFESDVVILSNVISHSAWIHRSARSLKEARVVLAAEEIHVVLCEARLPDGDWRKLLDFTAGLHTAPELIVLCRKADERLWSAVLNLGAWDLLTPPFCPKEVYRTIHHAYRHWADKMRVAGIAAPGKEWQAAVLSGSPKVTAAGM